MGKLDFIKEIAPYAQKVAEKYNILASLIIAQACHESRFGESGLARKGKNLFGVKGSYNGDSIVMKTWEHINGKDVYVDAAFRKYPSWYESLEDLAKLYVNGVSWDRDKYKAVIGEKDYKKACRAVQAAGYATDPNYAKKLINMIETYNLTQYDKKAAPAPKAEPEQAASTYAVKAGDTLSELAQKFNTTVRELQRLNGIKDPNKIYIGQVLKIPGASKATSASKTAPSPKETPKQAAGTYTVKAGDTLSGLARKFNTTVSELQRLNDIKDPDKIYVGQVLKLPSAKNTPVYHTVKKGDTVSELAAKYGTSIAKIKEWNKLKDVNKIYVGQKLRVK